MSVRRWTFLGALVVAVVACNAILGNAESIEYVDGDAIAPGPRDGADDDSSSVDGGEIDAAESLDAEPDTNVSCDSAVFCSDFDPPLDVAPWGFTNAVPNNGPAFGIDGTNVTPPNSLRIARSASDQQPHYLNYVVDRGRPFTVMFDVRVRTVNGFADLLQVTCRPSPTTMRVGINSVGQVYLAEGAVTATGPMVPLDQWLRIVFTVHQSSTTLYVYGASSTPMSLTRSCLPPFGISLGIMSQTAPWTALFDRVRVTAQ